MASIDLHPSELAYAFSYSRTEAVIGWGSAPFLPEPGADGDPADWLLDGEARLRAAGRLTGTPEAGLNFTEEMASAILALADPGLVLLAQRKEGDGMRTLTVHAAGDTFAGLLRRPDGMFELTRYADLTAAAGAGASFVGAALAPAGHESRIEANMKVLGRLKQLAGAGAADKVVAALVRLGAAEADARSAALALARPAAAGVLSVLYCAANEVGDAEPFSVMTDAEDRTWIVFPPAGPEGPVILERSSAGALAARIAVGVAARLAAQS
ncbi:hypothetical protein LNKW23_19020 [Paralimibaculum aggregatum]|uniref:ESAT-6 protein secretion system EspG family protein n=1 Tax=Paralimibaculum aggregatum TaxID=3036245 RepID=A0ABQ6LKE4_9RHOB|nr:hypothetical protein [Limibaculum sp. NKW23]GMG82689.1 hypothetical protein LNKW23_19020 [Limibaculum sp. NKW23]